MQNTLGGRISQLLEAHKITQRELATRAGITPVSLCRYINNERVPKTPILANIAMALNTTSEYLVGGSSSNDATEDYICVKQAIARSSKSWSENDKKDLIRILLD